MTDENAQPEQDQVPQDSAPVDGTVSTNNPHPVDEDPEEHVGDEQPDPWSQDAVGSWRPQHEDVEQPAEAPQEQNPEENA
jgi:hypothetical protein